MRVTIGDGGTIDRVRWLRFTVFMLGLFGSCLEFQGETLSGHTRDPSA
jgi:hypothetical protein